MTTFGKVALGLLAVSYLGSFAALMLGAFSVGKLLVLPGLLLSGWAFVGHLVTLDDDMSGGWSNPDGSRKVWLTSRRELLLKFIAFGVALWLFFAQVTP